MESFCSTLFCFRAETWLEKKKNEQKKTKQDNTNTPSCLNTYICFLSTHPEDEIEDDQGVFDALLRAGQRRHPAARLSAKHREGITVDTGSLPNKLSRVGRVRFCESDDGGDEAITRGRPGGRIQR